MSKTLHHVNFVFFFADEICGQHKSSPNRILEDLDQKCKHSTCNTSIPTSRETDLVNQINNKIAITSEIETQQRQHQLRFKRQNDIRNNSKGTDIPCGSVFFYGKKNFSLKTSGRNKINDNNFCARNILSDNSFELVPEQYHKASSPQ